MAIPRSLRGWLRLPGRAAVLIGLGALSTAGARADVSDQDCRAASGDVLIRSEGGRIYLSEGGSGFEELRLGDTAEARHLRQLLEEHVAGPAGLRLNPTILAGGGGSGYHWWTPGGILGGNTGSRDKPGITGSGGSSEKSTTPEKASVPRKAEPGSAGKKG